jgi:hypothetical protein
VVSLFCIIVRSRSFGKTLMRFHLVGHVSYKFNKDGSCFTFYLYQCNIEVSIGSQLFQQ